MVDGLHLYSSFLITGHPKRSTMASNSPIHAHIHAPTAVSTMQGNGQIVRRIEGKVYCSGTPRHSLAGDETSNPPVTSPPALPPEPHINYKSTHGQR